MRGDRAFLEDVLDSIQRITSYTIDGRDRFLADRMMQDAVIRNFEVIGEAVKNLSNAIRDAHPAIPWKRVSAFRNTVVHRYFRIDYELVWEIIEKHLPALRSQLDAILNTLPPKAAQVSDSVANQITTGKAMSESEPAKSLNFIE